MGWFKKREPYVVGSWERNQIQALQAALNAAEQAGDAEHVEKLRHDIRFAEGAYNRAIRLEREVRHGVAQPYD